MTATEANGPEEFFKKPILNSPYLAPSKHWELDKQGQPTQQILPTRRSAEFVTPIPKPKKQKGKAEQASLGLGDLAAGAAGDLKNTNKANLFIVFGEPDIDVLPADGGQVRVKINGVDVFMPNTGEVRSDGADGIACWFIDTDYNEESFFVRHTYFLGANDPYKALKTTLKAEINEEAWSSLHSDTSRPFPKPTSGRIAVKVINHLGDEVMKAFKVT